MNNKYDRYSKSGCVYTGNGPVAKNTVRVSNPLLDFFYGLLSYAIPAAIAGGALYFVIHFNLFGL